MKNWTLLMFLYVMTLSCQIHAQEALVELPIEKFAPYFSNSDKSIIERTNSYENFSMLAKVLKVTHLDQVLAYDGDFTVFAPSNNAFNELPKATTDKLLDPKNKYVLKSILSYHIIAGKLSASSILRAMCRGNGSATFTTILGEKITATINGIDIVLTDNSGNTAIIVRADSNQSNGIIHEIDTVFLPAQSF